MTDDTILPFSFPAVHTKKVTADFDGGPLTSNGGVMPLAMAERRLGFADNFPDRRDPTRVVHCFVDMFRARMFATLRLRLLKIAARVVETTSCIRLAFVRPRLTRCAGRVDRTNKPHSHE